MSDWKDVTPEDPKEGTECLYIGIDHGDYGYTKDKRKMYRGVAMKPVEEKGVLYPQVRLLESTPRYWNGFTPLKYKVIE